MFNLIYQTLTKHTPVIQLSDASLPPPLPIETLAIESKPDNVHLNSSEILPEPDSVNLKESVETVETTISSAAAPSCPTLEPVNVTQAPADFILLTKGKEQGWFDIPMDYILSFSIYPFDVASGWTSILHFTMTDHGCCKPGDRMPALLFNPDSTQLQVVMSSISDSRFSVDVDVDLPLNTTTLVTIIVQGESVIVMYDGIFQIQRFMITPRKTGKAKLYTGGRWEGPAFAKISNVTLKSLKFDHGNIKNPYFRRTDEKIPKKLWAYWDSSPPRFIMDCHAGWKRYNPSYEVNLITNDTLSEFISSKLPENFNDVSSQARSDWIRLAVLKEHGGIWMDASTVVTGDLAYIHMRQESEKTEGFMFCKLC
jgi:hypothetical protein